MEQKVKVTPSDVVFFPYTEFSQQELTIKNEWDKPFMFKMKSTRPGVLKMRPVFGIIKPKASKTIKLSMRCADPNDAKISEKDRFTVVAAPIPKKLVSVAAIFKENKAPEVRLQAVRKVLKIKIGEKKPSVATASAEEKKESKEEIKEKKESKEEIKEEKKESKEEVKPEKKESKEEVKTVQSEVKKVEKKEKIKEDTKDKSKKSHKRKKSSRGKIKKEKKTKKSTDDQAAAKKTGEEEKESSSTKTWCSTCSCHSNCGRTHKSTAKTKTT
ncbi:unnamed protein product [Bursaphelenchus okinawaensis]|uniref:Major sperm protein n=1 Tax=Bursaphelenchus okinawaensis TaxID=465554 RepID=A0A811K982_9BILA|nr:unnamed protein product [Bursaphelenchus okinawaensis]CAG9094671.1 unnamed protein product [Bursaphelenchus okinawaensis]